MRDLLSINDMLARLRADAASEQFEGARLGPIAVRELLRRLDSLVAEAAELRRERDELATRLAKIERADEPPRPAGWKAVPVDPTPEMIDAADSVDWRDDDTRGSVINMWNCMLAVAPEQAEPAGGCGDEREHEDLSRPPGWWRRN